MSEFMREALPIMVMFGFVLLLAPFIAFAMWMAFDGDRLRVVEAVEVEVEVDASTEATQGLAPAQPGLTVAEAAPAA